MPIMPTIHPDTAEARRAWLLSREAARHLGAPGGDRDARVRILENAHLMLRAHGAGGDFAPLGRPVRDALDGALVATFPGEARDEALEGLVDRLRAVAHPDGEPVPDGGASAFFSLVAASLAA